MNDLNRKVGENESDVSTSNERTEPECYKPSHCKVLILTSNDKVLFKSCIHSSIIVACGVLGVVSKTSLKFFFWLVKSFQLLELVL